MEVNSLFFNDAATALVRNRQATENAWRLNNRTDNPHFKATEDWWSRYTVGCRLPGGAYVMTMSQTALWPFANHECNMAKLGLKQNKPWGDYESDVWNSVAHRHKILACSTIELNRDISAGEQITDDYSTYQETTAADGEERKKKVAGWCEGKVPNV